LKHDEIRHYLQLGGERIYFTKEEMQKLRYEGSGEDVPPPHIRLLCFRSSDFIRDEWQLGSAVFLVPDESQITGSSVAAKALHKAMIEEDVVGIVAYRRTSVRYF